MFRHNSFHPEPARQYRGWHRWRFRGLYYTGFHHQRDVVMKISKLGAVSWPTLALAAGLAAAAWPSLAEESTYQPWSGATQAQSGQTADQKLQKLVTDLNALIKKAETAKAADPNFIADLKKLSAAYPATGSTASQLGGPGVVFLSDNFADGNYT